MDIYIFSVTMATTTSGLISSLFSNWSSTFSAHFGQDRFDGDGVCHLKTIISMSCNHFLSKLDNKFGRTRHNRGCCPWKPTSLNVCWRVYRDILVPFTINVIRMASVMFLWVLPVFYIYLSVQGKGIFVYSIRHTWFHTLQRFFRKSNNKYRSMQTYTVPRNSTTLPFLSVVVLIEYEQLNIEVVLKVQ